MVKNNIRKNKIYYINNILISFIILILISNTVFAHPPSKLNSSYDDEINELIVNITHSVTTDDHYIDTIELYINDVKYNTLNYDNQRSRTSFSYNYNIIVEDGDTIKVIAKCNQFGTLTKELSVGEENNGNSTPGFISILLIFSMIIVTMIYKKRK